MIDILDLQTNTTNLEDTTRNGRNSVEHNIKLIKLMESHKKLM